MKKNKKLKFDLKYKVVFIIAGIAVLVLIFFGASRSFLVRGKENNENEFEFIAYNEKILGQIALTCGDINGDGEDEVIIVANKENNVSDIQIFSKEGDLKESFVNKLEKKQLNPNITAGDVDGDGKEEIITVPDSENSRVKIYKNKKVISKFTAFKNAKIGASLASGDVNSDGKDEIIVGAGRGGGPQVKIFDKKGNELASFFVFYPLSRDGINVASGSIDNDSQEEIIVSQKFGGQELVKVYKFDEIKSFYSAIHAYSEILNIGVNVYAGNLDDDEKVEIMTTRDEEKGDLELKIFNSDGSQLDIFSSGFENNIQNKEDMAICNFKDKGGIAMIQNFENGQKVKIFYK